MRLQIARVLRGDGLLALNTRAMLALECDELRSGLGHTAAQPAGLRLRPCQFGLKGLNAGQRRQGTFGFGQQLLGFAQGFRTALFGVGDGGDLGLGFAGLPFQRRQHVARLGKLALGIAPKLPQAPFLGLRRTMPGIGRRRSAACGLGAALLVGLLFCQHPQAASLGQAAGGGGGALRRGDVAVPTPQVALARDEALSRPQPAQQAGALALRHQTDLGEPPRQLGGRRHIGAQRLGARRQDRVALGGGVDAPVQGRRLGRWGLQIIAKRRRQRHLVARGDADLIEDRRQATVARGLEQLLERLHLGLQVGGHEVGFACRIALGFGLEGCHLGRLLGGECLRLDHGNLGHQPLSGLRRHLELGGIRRPADDLTRLRLERRELALEFVDLALAFLALAFDAEASRPRLCRRARQLKQPQLGTLEFCVAGFVALQSLLLEVGGQRRGAGERLGFRLQPRQRVVGFGAQKLLTLQIMAELLDAGLQLTAAVGGALRLALQIVLFDLEAVQHRTFRCLLIAQRLQLGGGVSLRAQRFGLALGRQRQVFQRARQIGLFARDLVLRLLPVQVQDEGVTFADLGGQVLVAAGLPGLTLQALDLGLQLAQNVIDARQIVVRRFEPQLRLVPTGVQPGDSRRILENTAPLLGLGIDEFADLSLPDQGR